MLKYVLITPARNEGVFIGSCIESVLAQTHLPSEWVIVSDRSTDTTDKIVEGYAAAHPFIKTVRLTDGSGRDFGAKVNAFNAGYRALSVKDYRLIGNLDADVTISPDYFRSLAARFEADKKLGLAGGVILELIGKRYRKQLSSLESVAGAVQLFRRECFEAIGGLVPLRFGGVDAAAEIMARMKGWAVRSFDDLEVLHHRRVSGSTGVVKARFRSGVMHYQLGYHPLFQIVSTAYRLSDSPFIAGSVLTLFGYLWAWAKRVERPVNRDFTDYLASEQLSRVRSLFKFKFS